MYTEFTKKIFERLTVAAAPPTQKGGGFVAWATGKSKTPSTIVIIFIRKKQLMSVF